MDACKKKAQGRIKRKKRVRKTVFGEPFCPRLSVFRSAKHIYGQIVDDVEGKTLLAFSSQSKDVRDSVNGGNIDGAKIVGKTLGEKAKAAGIERVVFDRNGFKYHGRIKAFADAAREVGLQF